MNDDIKNLIQYYQVNPIGSKRSYEGCLKLLDVVEGRENIRILIRRLHEYEVKHFAALVE